MPASIQHTLNMFVASGVILKTLRFAKVRIEVHELLAAPPDGVPADDQHSSVPLCRIRQLRAHSTIHTEADKQIGEDE